jgi:hypothetical protein
MPFDFKAGAPERLSKGAEQSVPVLPPFATGRQGLRNLAYVLRNPALWRERHDWFFGLVCVESSCGTSGCAIGIAMSVWPEIDRLVRSDELVTDLFGMSYRDAGRIFFSWASYGKRSPNGITPGMVADAIDAYLARTA